MAGNLCKNGWLRRSTRYVSRIIDLSNCLIEGIYLGYAPLIKPTFPSFLQSSGSIGCVPEFNGLFEYEEYVTLKGIDDPNEGVI